MPKAKRYKGRRLTKPQVPRKRRRFDGRPKGTLKRYKFEETKLGFMLKYEVPVVYDIIMNMCPKSPFPEPPLLLILTICRNSRDPSLAKPKFWRYMNEYENHGLYCKRPKKLTPERKVYYERIRKKKLELFIAENREMIEFERKRLEKK